MGSESHDTSRRTILKGSALGAGAILGAAALPATARAATGSKPDAVGGPNTYLMKIENAIIPLTSFSFGVGRQASDGRATGKEATPTDFHFKCMTTLESPSLMDYLLTGTLLPAVQLIATNANNAQYLKVDMKQVIVSSYEFSAPDDEVPTDTGALSYGKITYSYYPSNVDGKLGTPNSVTWDVRSDKVQTT